MPRAVIDLPVSAKRLLQEVASAPTYADGLIFIRRYDNSQLTDEQLEYHAAVLTDAIRELPQ